MKALYVIYSLVITMVVSGMNMSAGFGSGSGTGGFRTWGSGFSSGSYSGGSFHK